MGWPKNDQESDESSKDVAARPLIHVANVVLSMATVDESVIDEATERSQNLLFKELIQLIERAHPDAPGVSRETLDAYARELGGDSAVPFTTEEMRDTIDDRLTDDDRWTAEKALYAFDDRISTYPLRWHDALGGTTDIPAYIRFIEDEVAGNQTDFTGIGPGDGIQEEDLLDLVATIGRVERGAAKTHLEQLRGQGDIAEGADQHPDARVYLRDRTDRRDPALEE